MVRTHVYHEIRETLLIRRLAQYNLRLAKPEGTAINEDDTDKDRPLDDIITECLRLCKPLLKHVHCVVVTLGKHGALVCRDTAADTPFPTAHHSSHLPTRQHSLVSARHFPASGPGGHAQVGNVTGAGDR